jgi:hypothetical protein
MNHSSLIQAHMKPKRPPKAEKKGNITKTSVRIRTASDNAHQLVPEALLLVGSFGVLAILMTIGGGHPTISLIAQQVLLCRTSGHGSWVTRHWSRLALAVLQPGVAVDQSGWLLGSVALRLMLLLLLLELSLRLGVKVA